MSIFTLLSRKQALLLLFLITLLPFGIIAQDNQAAFKGYGTASYKGANKGQHLKTWLVAGPLVMDSSAGQTMSDQEKFFNEDLVTSVEIGRDKPVGALHIKTKDFQWQPYTATNDILNFDSVFRKVDYATGYALAEILADSSATLLLGIGSDDAVKVWLNGKLVHSFWGGRGTVPDNDIVPVSLVKGSNQLLVKVHNMQGGWGFTARFLDKGALAKRLVAAAGNGNIDDINMLLNAGAGINEANESGLTAVSAAKLHGREEVVKMLLQKGAADVPIPSPDKMVDGLYASLNKAPAPGIAVLVAKDGKILYKKAFGYADIEKKKLVTTETTFRIGSITKQFIGAAILKLQEEGLLTVTDKLSKYIPAFPRGNEVTLHHLLTHTSGIHSFTDKDDFLSKVIAPVKTEDLVNSIQKDSFDFSPGDQMRYNNSGYFLLGYIIQKITGKTYGQYLKQAFFDPLQMKNTGVYSSSVKFTSEAKGYNKVNEAYERALNWDMSWAGGAGALYSTVEDLYKWNEALFGGRVLSEKSLAAAFTPVVLNNGKKPEGEYGYGWGISKYRGLRVIQHSGGLHGFISQLARFPEEKLSVVMLTNVTPTEVMLNPQTIGEYYLSSNMEKQATYTAQDTVISDPAIYEGRYDFQRGNVMTITSDGKNLFAQLSGQGKFPIFPSAPDEFFWKVVEARIKFVRNDKGEVTAGQFYQNGAEINAPKLKEEAIIKIDTALYKAYTGNYKLENDTITIRAINGQLFALAPGNQKYEIYPVSDTTFVLKELNARITFFKETAGAVSKIIVEMGGVKRDAPRLKQ